MDQPSEQWFREYVYTDGEPDGKGGFKTPPSYGPVEKTVHTHHPDAYHPDTRVRVAYQYESRRKGLSLTACGKEQDPRNRVVEPHDKADRCAKCIAAIDAAMEAHARALDALKAKVSVPSVK